MAKMHYAYENDPNLVMVSSEEGGPPVDVFTKYRVLLCKVKGDEIYAGNTTNSSSSAVASESEPFSSQSASEEIALRAMTKKRADDERCDAEGIGSADPVCKARVAERLVEGVKSVIGSMSVPTSLAPGHVQERTATVRQAEVLATLFSRVAKHASVFSETASSLFHAQRASAAFGKYVGDAFALLSSDEREDLRSEEREDARLFGE